MTQQTPGYSSPGPNTVIGHRPAGLEWARHLRRAAAGHAGQLAAAAEEAQADHVRREIGRQGLADEAIPRG